MLPTRARQLRVPLRARPQEEQHARRREGAPDVPAAADHPRSLLLDATTAAVTAGNQIGIFAAAVLVQKLHPHAVVVVVSGSLISRGRSSVRRDRQQDYRGRAAGQAAAINGDREDRVPPPDLRRPARWCVASRRPMRRRVPSHFVLMYKSGMQRLVQAAAARDGRAGAAAPRERLHRRLAAHAGAGLRCDLCVPRVPQGDRARWKVAPASPTRREPAVRRDQRVLDAEGARRQEAEAGQLRASTIQRVDDDTDRRGRRGDRP